MNIPNSLSVSLNHFYRIYSHGNLYSNAVLYGFLPAVITLGKGKNLGSDFEIVFKNILLDRGAHCGDSCIEISSSNLIL